MNLEQSLITIALKKILFENKSKVVEKRSQDAVSFALARLLASA